MLSLKTNPKKKIVVAMSGGVDSSVVAALLADQGHEVIGITLQLYDLGLTLGKKGACCAGQDIYDAQTAAEKIGIPHYVLNYESIFKQQVMEDFADSYMRGETPIPCVKCNQKVKFQDLFKMAKDLGADALATGHYVRRIEGKQNAELHMAIDPKKDQSYFLFTTTQEQLNFLQFPLGNQSKEQTREMATHYGLEIANKPDSQDICFVPDGNYASVIERLRPGALDKGSIVDESGKVLGEHNGIINFTIGKRRGIGIAAEEPLYVVKINPERNEIVVGPRSSLASKSIRVNIENWIGDEPLNYEPKECQVKLRSMHKPLEAVASKIDDKTFKVELLEPYEGVTPGQACVVYDGTRLLGGGWILRN